jgi:hypothetical protein
MPHSCNHPPLQRRHFELEARVDKLQARVDMLDSQVLELQERPVLERAPPPSEPSSNAA